MTPPTRFAAAALPPDVRKVFDLPSAEQNLPGLRPIFGAQPL